MLWAASIYWEINCTSVAVLIMVSSSSLEKIKFTKKFSPEVMPAPVESVVMVKGAPKFTKAGGGKAGPVMPGPYTCFFTNNPFCLTVNTILPLVTWLEFRNNCGVMIQVKGAETVKGGAKEKGVW